ncbi:hypothetical protein PJ311_14715 [Bacillus sp. CLL-7-23]|uniref:Lipoprotein n=1 Tax=Bacillus changyiensis TaxID=3004103 RepID=A0ABT4X6A8_9BACI|nr:hypothetical protein [Bacillus changyiensis]MDA7027829.1 hypothetical protein [Bacillus changyiensis]
MKKNWLLLLITSVLVFALAACQQVDPKQSYTTAFKKMLDSKIYDFSTDIDINIDTSNLTGVSKEVAEVFNNADLTVDFKANKDTKQSQFIFKGKFSYRNLSMNFNVPVYLDENKKRGYIKLDSLIENFGIILGPSTVQRLESVKGKYLEFPLEKGDYRSQDTEKVKRLFLKSLETFADDFPQDKFKEEDLTDKEKQQGTEQRITLSFSDKEIKDAYTHFAKQFGKELNHPIKESDLSDLQQELKEVKFKKFNMTTSINKEKSLQHLTTDVSIGVDNKDFQGDFNIKFSTAYNSLDRKVKFEYKPEEDQIVTMDELEGLVDQSGREEINGFTK